MVWRLHFLTFPMFKRRAGPRGARGAGFFAAWVQEPHRLEILLPDTDAARRYACRRAMDADRRHPTDSGGDPPTPSPADARPTVRSACATTASNDTPRHSTSSSGSALGPRRVLL